MPFHKTNSGTVYRPTKSGAQTQQPPHSVPQQRLAPMREVEAFVNMWLEKVGK